jgi:hypothetical protein
MCQGRSDRALLSLVIAIAPKGQVPTQENRGAACYQNRSNRQGPAFTSNKGSCPK